MRKKVKILAVAAIAVTAILAIVLVSCAGGATAENTAKWLEGENVNATVVDNVNLKNIKINFSDGLLKGDIVLSNIDIKATRTIVGKKKTLELNISNIGDLQTPTAISSVTGIVPGLKLAGLKEISAKLIVTYDPDAADAVTLEFHGYDLNKFLTSLPAGDSNPENHKEVVKKEAISGKDHEREEALIGAVIALIDNPIYGPATFDKDGKGTSNLENIIALANVALEKYGSDKIWLNGAESEYTAKSIIDSIFGEGKSSNIASVINDVLKIQNLKMGESKTQKVDGKEVYQSHTMTAVLNAKLKGTQVGAIVNTIGNLNVISGEIAGTIQQVLKGDITLSGNITVSTEYKANK